MKNFSFYLLLFLLLGCGKIVCAQDIAGETNIVPGGSYDYSYTGASCGNSNTYVSWSVTGGTFAPNGAGGITVTWSCSAQSHEVSAIISGEDYDYDCGCYFPTSCGTSYLSSFTIIGPTLGTISIPYNFSGVNEVCPNLPFTLAYSGSAGLQRVDWFRWDGANWQAAGSSTNADFTIDFPSISSATDFKAQPFSCNGTALTPQAITVTIKDVTAAKGIVLGARDVLFGNNSGKVTFADYQGFILNWQRSEDGGTTWTDIGEMGEELFYTDLTVTTQFRVKSFLYLSCGEVFSQSCTVRVTEGSLNWVENKSYDESNQVVGNSRSYFDLSGRLLQTQSKNLSQGKILAVQPLFSRFDQAVGSTLPAPILESNFTYKAKFVTPIFTASIPYTYSQFDTGSYINNPAPVGNGTQGTLGWYYSLNNTLEPNTAITAYPYSRTEEAPDGSTGVVRSSGVGETFRMGQGKESVQGTFSVRNELNTYAQLRNRYFPASVIGEQVASLNAAATQQVGINSNGEKAVSFQDKEGHIVMVAQPGHSNGWENISNTVEIGWPYCFVKSDNQLYETPDFQATADIKVYDANYTLIFEGHARDFGLKTYTAACRIYCNEPFRIVTGRILNATTNQPISFNSMYELLPTKREAYAYYNFYTFETGSTTVTNQISGSDYTVKNTINGTDVTSLFKSNATIPAGFYQIRIVNGAVNLNYSNSYLDISYSFYNQKGQLLGSLAPNGTQLVTTDLSATNLSTYPSVATLPFYTSYEYDVRGRLLALNETDAGRTNYYYRTDGKIRFSQNAKQLPLGYFSYTNYDDVSRPVEAGECRPTNPAYFATIATDAVVLESTDPRGGFALDQTRKDVVVTTYDLPVSLPSLGSAYVQDFLAGRISQTKKYDVFIPQSGPSNPVSRTWFSYDDQGRTKWVARQMFNGYPHTLDYEYDLNGNVQTAVYNKNESTTRFTHYYSYDADHRLSEVRTNAALPTDQSVLRTLQATYSYYLHGPLKRVVIGGLQGVDYLYTAQGWLKSINGIQQGGDPGQDATATTGLLPDLFSQELEYYAGDYYSAQHDEGTFSSTSNHPERFDGTLRASAWRTPSHPGLHGYGYAYDEHGQLSRANYGQPVPGTSGNIGFAADPLGRYKEDALSYDPNGNLLTLRRTDRIGDYVMNIGYQYLDKTNKLARVRHPQALNTPIIDYTYDALGQLTAQQEPGKNKYFDYDVTGKVTRVYRNAAKTDLLAEYLYDEFGQRIRQSVYNAQGDGEYTEYIRDVAGNEVASYYYDAGPEIMRLSEQPIYGATRIGVVRQPRGQEAGAQLYELNDQLGNTRVVFQQPHTDKYVLTMEDGNTDKEAQAFPTPDATTYKEVRTSDAAMQASPYGQGYSMDLFARVGPGKKLAVSPGDHVLLEAYAAYSSGNGPILGRPQPTGPSLPKMSIVLGTGALSTQPVPQETAGSRPLPAWQRLLSQASVGVAIPIFSHAKEQKPVIGGPVILTTVAPPKAAALRYVLRLVRDQSIVRTGTATVTSDAEGRWEKLSLDVAIDVEEPAELETWVENKDKMHVYFDDLSVEHQVGPIVQENHFYAYGQRNEGLSWTRQYLRGYGRGYQGQHTRFDEETGYDNFELRLYDSRIGRWNCPDPKKVNSSPYMAMGNNPVKFIDPDGGQEIGEVVVIGHRNSFTGFNLNNFVPPSLNIDNIKQTFNKYFYTKSEAKVSVGLQYGWDAGYTGIDVDVASVELLKIGHNQLDNPADRYHVLNSILDPGVVVHHGIGGKLFFGLSAEMEQRIMGPEHSTDYEDNVEFEIPTGIPFVTIYRESTQSGYSPTRDVHWGIQVKAEGRAILGLESKFQIGLR